MYPSIDQWNSMNRIDGRGDFGGPIQKGIVSYSVSSNAQVMPALTEMPNDSHSMFSGNRTNWR